MKKYTLEYVQDKLIGKVGTANRNRFEYELQMDLIGKAIKQTCQERTRTLLSVVLCQSPEPS